MKKLLLYFIFCGLLVGEYEDDGYDGFDSDDDDSSDDNDDDGYDDDDYDDNDGMSYSDYEYLEHRAKERAAKKNAKSNRNSSRINRTASARKFSSQTACKKEHIRASLFSSIFSKREYDERNEIVIPYSEDALCSMHFKDVIETLRNLGFINIKKVQLKDVRFGIIHKVGEVERVTIGGVDEFKKRTIFRYDEEVVITYHVRRT